MSTLQPISDSIDVIPNFPKEGIMFRDMSGLLAKPNLFESAIENMAKLVKHLEIDYIVGIEARGFLFTGVARHLNCGFVMIRKPNKLPNCISVEYEKEYGTDTICINKDIIKPGSKILLIDDLLATGGTFDGGRQLIESIGSTVVGYLSLIELIGFDVKIDRSMIYSLLKYNKEQESKTLLNHHIKEYIPMDIGTYDRGCTIVFYHPSVKSLAENYIANTPYCRKCSIIWGTFPDGQPNVSFEDMSQLENRRVVFFISLYDKANLLEQLSMLMIMPRQFIRSLNIYITYFSVGTMERVEHEGMLATAETMAKMISNCITVTTKEGPAIVHIYDIHALPVRFYFTDNIIVKLESAIPLLLKKINKNSIIVFPDDGAAKRFGRYFKNYKIIVCSKVREDDRRIIKIVDKINFPNNDTVPVIYDEAIIIDDLVQSGGTLKECKNALELLGYKNISAYVTHSVFPNDNYRKIKDVFHNFYTTNSIPEITDKLNGNNFKVIKLFGENEYKEKVIYVASHNQQKLKAVYDMFVSHSPGKNFSVRGIAVSSDVPEQPIGDETKIGANNRMNNMLKYLNDNKISYDYCVSLENGLSNNDEGEYFDFSCCLINNNKITKKSILHHSIATKIPKEYYDECVRLEQKTTIGEVIQNFTGIPKDNWHQHYDESGDSRIELMYGLISTIIESN